MRRWFVSGLNVFLSDWWIESCTVYRRRRCRRNHGTMWEATTPCPETNKIVKFSRRTAQSKTFYDILVQIHTRHVLFWQKIRQGCAKKVGLNRPKSAPAYISENFLAPMLARPWWLRWWCYYAHMKVWWPPALSLFDTM